MSRPNIAAQRDAIKTALDEGLEGAVRVFRAAPAGHLPTAFVLIGMPSWSPPSETGCMHLMTWAVAVCVGRSGTNDELTAKALEDLWPAVLDILDAAADDAFGGVCTYAKVVSAVFDVMTIQGQELPAQMFTIEMQ